MDVLISLNDVCMYTFVVSVRIQKLELKNVKMSRDLKELEDLKAESARIKLVTVYNHNYNKIVKSDWLSAALISALIGQFNRTVRVMPK